jgi:hypothetical protein
MLLDLTGVPAESRLTLRTPHLVTAVDLANLSSTLRAGLGLLLDGLDGLNEFRVAHVGCGLGLGLVAILTDLDITQAAHPLRTQEALAGSGRALLDKYGLLLLFCGACSLYNLVIRDSSHKKSILGRG